MAKLALSMLWVLIISGHIIEVSSKKTASKKRHQVPRSAARNFVLHSSTVKINDDARLAKPSWRTRSLLLKRIRNNNYNSLNGDFRKGDDLNKSERIGYLPADKNQAVLRNRVFTDKEILIDNGDEVWPKSEEEPGMREHQTEEGQMGNFDGSHNDKFENDELNLPQDNLLENNIVQAHYNDSSLHETVAQNGRANSGLVGINTAEQASRGDGVQQGKWQTTDLNENFPKLNFFKITSGFKSERGERTRLDIKHQTLRNASTDPENEHSIRQYGGLHANQNATLPYAYLLPEEQEYSSPKPFSKVGYNKNTEQLNTTEYKNVSGNYDQISLLVNTTDRLPLENIEQNYNHRQRQSHRHIKPENLRAQRLQQLVNKMRPQVINQTMKIVQFLEMATGIPIYHKKPMADTKIIQQRTSNISLTSDAVPKQPKESVQDDSNEERKQTHGRHDEEAVRKPPIPNPHHLSTQYLLEQPRQVNKHRLPPYADFRETNKETQSINVSLDQKINHHPSVRNSDYLSTQGLLEPEQKNDHHQYPAADFSTTNMETRGINGQQKLNNHKPLIPIFDQVSMKNYVIDQNKTTAQAVPNLKIETKSGVKEQTLHESNIFTDEPSMDFKSSQEVEGETVSSSQWIKSRHRSRSRYGHQYSSRNRTSKYKDKWRPSSEGGTGDNTGGTWIRPSTVSGQRGGVASRGVGGPAGSSVPQTGSTFAEDALLTHNKYRQVHNAGPMTLDRGLSIQAQEYAQKIASMHSMMHSSNQERGDDVGENLAYACKMNGVPLTGSGTTKMWYDEVCEYNFNTGGYSMDTGHFTQVVWKDSLGLGMGMAETSEGGMNCIYAVGRYRGAGNNQGQFRDKVLRGKFDRSYCNNVNREWLKGN